MDTQAVGRQISDLRRAKGLTQAELGDRLGVTYQAVSKWERAETLPDTAILPELAEVLETTVDNLLRGGQRTVAYTKSSRWRTSSAPSGAWTTWADSWAGTTPSISPLWRVSTPA